MDPNSSPWAYAYNRIVPSASGSNEDFQHTHLASISAAAGSSAQSLLLQAAHSSIAGFNATSGNFVPPSPIGGYSPVFQQIYHHAAQAAVQPKPAHYASSAVSTTHRQIGVTGVEKHENCRSQPAPLGYPSNQTINLPTSTYYGENSSSSGASPSPTTSVTSATTPSWNTPVVGSPQQITTNAFLTMHQQQQQQQNINQEEKVTNSKQSNPHAKVQTKNYEDLIYVGNHGEQHEQVALQLDNQIIHAVSQEGCPRSDEGFYTFVDGKLTYNIPAAVISSASLANKLPDSSVKVITPRKESSSDSHQPAQQQNLSQIPSPAYPIYESPSLCSSVGSPSSAVNSLHNSNEAGNNSGHIIVYKSNTPTQQAQTPSDVSAVGHGVNSRNNNYTRNSVSISSVSPTTGVAYSSVITSALQANQQQQLHQQNHHSQHPGCWPGSTTDKVSDASKHNQKLYPIQSPPVPENNPYVLPSSLQVKHTVIENVDAAQAPTQLQQRMLNNALHIIPPQSTADEDRPQPQPQLQQQTQSQQLSQTRQQSVESVMTANNTLASQIQCTTKVEEVQKPVPPKKAPRKRQPKKTLLPTNNDYSRTAIQNNAPQQHQVLRQQHQQTIQHHQPQQPPPVQLQQQNSSFYDYNNRWIPHKIESGPEVAVFSNTHQPNPIPQPAHVQSSQTHAHIPQYFPAFQQLPTEYATCMTQNSNLYNMTSLGGQNAAQDQQQQQQQQQHTVSLTHTNLHQQTTSIEAQPQPQPEEESSTYKVIVPNIEDELHFLSNDDPKTYNNNNNNFYGNRTASNQNSAVLQNKGQETANSYHPYEGKPPVPKKSGFMDSYLKFLQGERDESPPPMIKTGRKFNYTKPAIQTENFNSNKRKLSDTIQPSDAAIIANSEASLPVGPATAEVPAMSTNANCESVAATHDDGHKVKIISQTQILPKKRPHAHNMAAAIQQPQEVSQQQQSQSQAHELQSHLQIRQNQQPPKQPNFHQDPLALPPRREQSLRKAKSRSINEIMASAPTATDRDEHEPEEFADSDADPVWTPQDDDSDDTRSAKLGNKRKARRTKSQGPMKKKEDSVPKDIKSGTENENVKKMSPAKSICEVNNASGNISTADNFKTGDFIVLRSDLVNDWPIIWQVDSKCILQKYEPFCQNGKMFYRNMSKYASWNLDTKKLYLKAPVRIQIQSHTETIVEFMRSELLADDTEQFIEKIMDDYLAYRDHFEIYIQTMISQVLDPSFLSEINREKDEYFLSSVRTIDDIMENCKRKLLSITPWTRSVIMSIETWPQCHVFTEWGQNNVNQKNCGGCHQPGISVRFLLFGHPYNTNTMQTIPVDVRVAYEKDILLCRICAARADIFHKIAHEKYNLFAICTRRVGEHQKEYPGKSSTEILNDLLAENNWVDELFRNMRSSWAEVESLERQKRFHEVSQ